MMEAVRALGFAARFVSGYLYSPNLDGSGNVGGGATHAWTQVYLPGSGWVEFDPTNGAGGAGGATPATLALALALALAPTLAPTPPIRGGGGGYYGYRSYGGAGLGGVLGLVLVVFIVLWLLGALGGRV